MAIHRLLRTLSARSGPRRILHKDWRSLSYDPKKADTLFNLGIVKWQGKKDGPGAVAAWKKLLETNPAYPDKEAVPQLMAQAQQR